jgi:HEAT repeat protein
LVRREALGALKTSGTFSCTEVLAALKDPDPGVRAEACEVLGTSRSAVVVIPLMACLADADPYVRLVAVQSLRSQDQPCRQLLPTLIGGLNDKDPGVRGRAVVLLYLMAEEIDDVERHLIPMQYDPNESVRCDAEQALQRIRRDRRQ